MDEDSTSKGARPTSDFHSLGTLTESLCSCQKASAGRARDVLGLSYLSMMGCFRRIAILLLVGLASAACHTDGSSGRSARVRTHSVTAIAGGDVSEGQPRKRWLVVGSGRVPAWVGKNDYRVEVRVDRAANAVVRGAFGFAVTPGPPVPSTATFRIRWSSLSAEEDGKLLEATVTSGGEPVFEPFEISVPEDRTGGARIVFEVEFAGPKELEQRQRAAWIDPVVDEQDPSRVRPAAGAPNVLLITADTTRQDVLGPYGGAAPTPALDALAADGLVFDDAFSVAFGTTPSHAALFTASHAARTGVYDNRSIVSPEAQTLAEVFHGAGYTTAAFVSAVPVTRALGFSQGFDTFDDFLGRDRLSGLGRLSDHQRRADVTAERFLAWLDRRRTEPFFAWIHFYDPHQPYLPTAPRDPDRSRVLRYFEEDDGTPKLLRLTPGLMADPELLKQVEAEAFKRYCAEVSFMDRQLGRVLEELKTRGLYEEMTIAFVADHGENLAERGRPLAFYHQGLFTGVTRLPFLLKLAESRYAGSRRRLLLGNLDIAPTLLELAGIEPPPEWQGRSFRRLLGEEGDRSFRPYLVLEGGLRQEVSVRTLDWMYRTVLGEDRSRAELLTFLGYRPGRPQELYDLRTDPGESEPIDPLARTVSGRLEGVLDEFLAPSAAAAEREESAEHLKALKGLGYIE